MDKLKAATGLSETEITDLVKGLPCSYEFAYEFYRTFTRFPTFKEASVLPNAISLENIKQICGLGFSGIQAGIALSNFGKIPFLSISK